METEKFLTELATIAQNNEYRFDDLRARLPLGSDSDGKIILSALKSSENGFSPAFRHTCVVGTARTEFIRRLILTLSSVYDRGQSAFLVLSAKREYAELLRLKRADLVAPVLSSVKDVWTAVGFARAQARLRRGNGKNVFGNLFFVLDGLENFANGGLDCYLPFFKIATECGAHVITGVDLKSSVFADSPEQFVGAGNSLVTAMTEGVAGITYVKEDGGLTLPASFAFPSSPTVLEAVSLVEKF